MYLLRKNIKIKRLSDKLNYKKLRLYNIRKIIRLVNYELALLKLMGKIHLVFHISLLKPAPLRAPKALYIEVELTRIN